MRIGLTNGGGRKRNAVATDHRRCYVHSQILRTHVVALRTSPLPGFMSGSNIAETAAQGACVRPSAVRPKRKSPLSDSDRAALAALLERCSARELSRRWGVGAPTIAKAVGGGSLTSALGGWIASCLARAPQAPTMPTAA